MSLFLDEIKQESLPMVETSESPKNPTLRETYRSLLKSGQFVANLRQFDCQKVLLQIIESHENIWNSSGTKSALSEWEQVAIELFARLSIVASPTDVRHVWRRIKDNFQKRLKDSIHSGKDEAQTEEGLWRWNLYEYVRFFRFKLTAYEQEIRRRHRDGIEAELESNDDAFFEDTFQDEEEGHEEEGGVATSSQVLLRPAKIRKPNDDVRFSNSNTKIAKLKEARGNSTARENSFESATSSEVKPPVPLIKRTPYDETVDHIAYHARRVFSENPESKTLIRRAIFEVVFAFDGDKFDNMEELFDTLSARNKSKASRKRAANDNGDQ